MLSDPHVHYWPDFRPISIFLSGLGLDIRMLTGDRTGKPPDKPQHLKSPQILIKQPTTCLCRQKEKTKLGKVWPNTAESERETISWKKRCKLIKVELECIKKTIYVSFFAYDIVSWVIYKRERKETKMYLKVAEECWHFEFTTGFYPSMQTVTVKISAC